jgi:hypothetical protein
MRHGERAAQLAQSLNEKTVLPCTRSHDRPLSEKGMITDYFLFFPLMVLILRKASICSSRVPVKIIWY